MPVNDPDQYSDSEPQSLPDATAGLGGQMSIMPPHMQMSYPQPHMQMMLPTATIPQYIAQPGSYGYGYDGSGYTSARASYGDIPMMGMRGAQTVGVGAAMGIGDMFSAIGASIAPINYTPPARVFADYGNRYVQNVGVMADMKTLLGFGPMMRAGRESDLRYNAASDLGERMALGMTGAALSLGALGISSIGSAIGGAGLGFMGSLAGGLGGFAVAGLATERIQEGVAARRDMMGFLEATSDRFITGSGGGPTDIRRGAGFSSGGRRQVADFVRELDVKDPLLNTDELSRVLKDSTQLGLFSGTRDIDDFKTKFKTIVDSVKTVTTTLHQTLEEGLKTIRDLKGIGMDPAMAGGAVLRSEIAGRVAGKSAGEMLNLGLQGAEMFRGTGISMQIGFESNIMNAAQIRAARDAGMLSQEAISQAGGEEALAQRMTASSLAYTQTSAGRGFSALYFDAGAPGSGFNQQAFMNTVNAAGGDLSANTMTAARNLGNPAALIKFQANQEKMLSEMGKTYGGQGLAIRASTDAMMQATRLASITGSSPEDAFKMILKTQQGKSEAEAEAELAKIKNAGGAFAAAQGSAETTRGLVAQQSASQNFFVNRWQAELGDLITRGADVVAQPANAAIESVSQSAANAADYMVGMQRINLAGTGYEAQIVNDPVGAAARRAGRAVDIDRGGLFGMNAGEDLARSILSGKTGPFKFSGKGGNVTLMSRYGGNAGNVTASTAELDEAAVLARLTTRTVGSALEADVGGGLKNERAAARAALINLQGSQTLADVQDVGGLVQAVYGQGLGSISQPQYDALLLETQTSARFTQMTDSARKMGEKVLSARNAVSVASSAGDLEAAESAKSAITGILGGSASELSGSAIAKLADLNRLGQTPDSAAVERAKLAFKGELANISGSTGDTLRARSNEFIDRALSTDARLAGHFTAFSDNFRSLSEEQQRRGHEILTRAIEVDIFGATRDMTTDIEKKQIQGIIGRIGEQGVQAVQALGKDDLAMLGKTGSGALIQNEANIIAKIGSLKAGTNDADFRAAMPAMPAAQLNAVSEAYARGPQQAIEAVHAQTMDQLAGKSNIATAGNTAGVGAQGTGSADQAFAVQTSMNLQVLQALTALASKLKN